MEAQLLAVPPLPQTQLTKSAHGEEAAEISLLHSLCTHVPHAELTSASTNALQVLPPPLLAEKHLSKPAESAQIPSTRCQDAFIRSSTTKVRR